MGVSKNAPTAKLHVGGTGRFDSSLTVGAYTLPANDGANGQVLTTNGAGTVTWATAGPGASAWVNGGNTFGAGATLSNNNSMSIAQGGLVGNTLTLGNSALGFGQIVIGSTIAMNNANTAVNNGNFTVNNGTTTLNNGNVTINNGNVTINNGNLAVNNGQIYGSSRLNDAGISTIAWNAGNQQSSNRNCGLATDFTFTNLMDGGTYTLVVTDIGTAQCDFALPAGVTAFFWRPANAVRTANSRTVYTFMRIGTEVYVSWATGFQ